MKKAVIFLLFIMIISVNTVHADYPDKIGLGVLFGYNGNWEGGKGTSNAAFNFKFPILPVFFAVNLQIRSNYLGLSLQGDYYFLHKYLIREAKIHWYLGLGSWLALWGWGDGMGMAAGLRVPVGLSWQPIELIEVFMEIAPSLGVQILPDFNFPAGGFSTGLGIRIWF